MRPTTPATPLVRPRATAPGFIVALLAWAACLTATPPAGAADAATLTSLGRGSGAEDFLPPEQAFRVEARATAPDRIEVTYGITKGYYLYRNKLKFGTPAADVIALGQAALPEGETKTDDYFGTQQVYHHDFVARLPVMRAGRESLTVPVKLTWQGCADAGLCYPPQTRTFEILLPPADGRASAAPLPDATAPLSEQDRLASLIRSGNLALMLGAFFLSGLLLAFTPCVLPMVPIVSGIIAGHGASLTRTKGFLLSLAYVLGMALTYTAAGVGFAAAGQQAQTLFQQPWIITLFALLFVVMSLSMFGFFTVQMPAFIQTRLADLSNRQKAGSYAGVAVMGALSALIVTTCVGPALVAALSVIGQSGEMLRGGLALFAMAIGMGTPLLVVGASAGQLLPRAGAWMDTVKQVFGALMLAVAAWMLSRILSPRLALAAWVLPPAALAFVLWRALIRNLPARLAVRAAAVAALAWAALLGVGSLRGATDPLAPWSMGETTGPSLPFGTVKSVDDLDREVEAARLAGRPVLLDFYADWCVSCKEMEKFTFPDAGVRAALEHAVLLRADVTANDEQDQALLKRFGIFGPPTIAFYGPDGQERSGFRVVGFMKAAEFAPLAARALAASGAAQALAAR
jgi:thiol:disulfide interchange protein DsbD